LLPKPILEAPRLGCFNLHASLLPRWRGAAPIHRAVMAGDAETGVMVMRMEEGLDTGPVLATQRCAITDETTTGELQDVLAREGAGLMVEALGGDLRAMAQSADGVTYAKKIVPDEAKIDWKRPAREVLRHVHGLNPAPGAWTMAGDARLRLLRVRLASGGGVAGTVIAAPFVVACGEGALEVLELQRAGRGAQGVEEFRRGFPLAVGARLG
jgi:methionyl-tRNA formyltransferase